MWDGVLRRGRLQLVLWSFFCVSLFCAFGLSAAGDLGDWYQGSRGYREGVADARDSRVPMMVLFYANWCGYCRKLQGEILTNDEVQEVLEDVVKIRINVDKPDARVLAERYGVSGIPALFYHKSMRHKPQRISTAGSPESFVTMVKRLLASS